MKIIFISIIGFFLATFTIYSNSFELEKEIFISSYIKGINLAKAKGQISIKNNILNFDIKAESVGIFSLFSDWKQNIYARGLYKNNTLNSDTYQSNDSRGNKKGHMYLDFKNITPKIISAQPDPRKDKRRERINKKILPNTLDPFMGILNLGINGECNPASSIFDGKRKYILRSEKIEITKFKSNNFFKEDFKAVKCKFIIDKIAGYTKKEMERYPNFGFIWIKRLDNSQLYFPVKIKIETKWGNFVSLIKERNKISESNNL